MPSPKDPIKYAEYCMKISEALKGKNRRPHSEEALQKMREASKKLWVDPEYRNKTQQSMKKKVLSEEHKEKLRLAGFKRKQSEDTKEKCRLANIGKFVSEETKEKQRKSRIGKIASEKTKEKYRKRKQQLAKDEEYIERNRQSVILALNEIWYGGVKYNENKYCELWNENLRERCRAFFNYTCVECGNRQNGRKLAIHHVHYNKKSCCDGSPRDLIALCADCHGATNHNRAYWEQHFTEMLHGYYDGKSFFTKEEYAAYKNSN